MRSYVSLVIVLMLKFMLISGQTDLENITAGTTLENDSMFSNTISSSQNTTGRNQNGSIGNDTATTIDPGAAMRARFMQLLNYQEYLSAKSLNMITPYVIIPTTIVLNGLSFTVMRPHMLKSSSAFYMGLLAIWDPIYAFMSNIGVVIQRQHVSPGTAGCKFMSFLTSTSQYIAVWLVVTMTAERVIAVRFPFKMNQYCTVRRAQVTCACLVLVMATLNIFYLVTFEGDSRGSIVYGCFAGEKYAEAKKYWDWFDAIISSFLPLILLYVMNIVIIMSLRAAAAKRAALSNKTSGDPEKEKAQRQMTIMLLTVSVAFTLLTSPLAIYRIVQNLWDYMADYSMFNYAQHVLMVNVFFLLTYLNHCINFFLYVISGKKFRREFLQMFCCRRPISGDVSKTASTSLASRGVSSVSKTVDNSVSASNVNVQVGNSQQKSPL